MVRRFLLQVCLFVALGVRLVLLMLSIHELVEDVAPPLNVGELVVVLCLDILLVIATGEKRVFAALTSTPGRQVRLMLALSHTAVLLLVSLLYFEVTRSCVFFGFHAIFILIWISAWFILKAGFLICRQMSVVADLYLMTLVEIAFFITNALIACSHC